MYLEYDVLIGSNLLSQFFPMFYVVPEIKTARTGYLRKYWKILMAVPFCIPILFYASSKYGKNIIIMI